MEFPLGCTATSGLTLIRCVGSTGHITALKCPSGFAEEGVLGIVYPSLPLNGRAIYSCHIGTDHFDSNDPGCEGQLSLGLLGYLAGTCLSPSAPTSAPSSYPDGRRRYLVLGSWYNSASNEYLDIGLAAGHNAVRLTADWGNMEQTPGNIEWSWLDDRVAYVLSKGVPLIFNIWLRRNDPDTVVPLSGMAVNSHGVPSPNPNGRSISFANATSMASGMTFVSAVVRRYSERAGSAVLLFAVTFSGYSESEYWPGDGAGGYYDYSTAALLGYRLWLQQKYGTVEALNRAWPLHNFPSFDSVQPPTSDSTGQQYFLDWYLYREATLSHGIRSAVEAVKQSCVGHACRVGLQWGSIYDSVVRLRGLINFPTLVNGAEAIWVDDAPFYPHAYSMDILRSNLAPNVWIANEIDGPDVGDDNAYYQLASESFAHGCVLVSVANWNVAALRARTGLFQRIARDFLNDSIPLFNAVAVMTVSALAVFNNGTAMSGYLNEYNKLSNAGSSDVRVNWKLDL